MRGILTEIPNAEARKLLIEILKVKDKLFIDEKKLVNRLEVTFRRLTQWEAKRIYEIHGRVVK